jgi:TonB family protein
VKRKALFFFLAACGGTKTGTTTPPQPSASASSTAAISADAGIVIGDLPPDVIKSTVRAAFAHFKICYVAALKKNKSLGGRVEVKFVIDETGHVTSAEDVSHSNVLQDDDARNCIVEKFKQIQFPPPNPSGKVPVTYPLMFEPAMAVDENADAGAPPSGDTGDEYGHERAAFNPATAASALSKVDVKSCGLPGGFHGAGHVKVTFDPSGVPTKAQIDSTMANATTNACVTKAFMAVRVPVFSGNAVTVGKSFTVP